MTQKDRIKSGVKFSAIASFSVLLSACTSATQTLSSFGAPSVTASLQKPSPDRTAKDVAKKVAGKSVESELVKAIAYWDKKYRAAPKNPQYALNLARNLKFAGKEKSALEILRQSYRFNAGNRDVSGELGRLLVKNGQPGKAAPVLASALDKKNPDWRVLSALGTVSAQKGSFDEARSYFGQALSQVPNRASVLNNIAMTYMLEKKPAEAESYLRRAYAKKPSVNILKNLKHVLAAQGKTFTPQQKLQVVRSSSPVRSGRQAGIAAHKYGAPKTTSSVGRVTRESARPLDLTKKR